MVVLLIVLALVAAACGSDGDGGDATGDRRVPAEHTGGTDDEEVQPIGFVGAEVPPDDPGEVPAADVEAVAVGDTQLGLDLLVLAGAEGNNVFLSPYSVASALGMLLAGARGATNDEIAAVLSVDDENAFHPARGALTAAVTTPAAVAGDEAEPFTLRAANQLFGQDGFPFVDAYLELLARSYGADMGVVDFASQPEAARQLINGWVEEQTEERIVDLIPEGVISALTRLVLVNAVYFKANWREPFDPAATTPETFRDLDGTSGPVDMMHGMIGAGYAAGDGYEAFRLSYAGDTTSMLVVMPDEGTLVDFVGQLDAPALAAIGDALESTQLELAFPSFEFTTALGLRPLLEELGMIRAFDAPGADGADLTGITAEQVLFVQDALHQAFVSVDEEGTEAAAATAVAVGLTAVPEVVPVRVDRPFLFVIEHDETRETIFIGQVTQLAG